MANGLIIEAFTAFAENEKGQTFERFERPTSGFLIGYRNKGAHFGNHYHKGGSKSKDPEILWLLQGEWKVGVKKVGANAFEYSSAAAPCKIVIEKNFIHKIEAMQDSVFLEFNSLAEHNADTFYP